MVKQSIIQQVKKIAEVIKDEGGRAYYVGGFVRDKFTGMPNKDIDIEIFRIEKKQLFDILSEFGKVEEVGSSFGVYKIHGLDIDFSLPRTEYKNGKGHKGFEIEVDPYLSTLSATKRRDFTMNSIMQDVLTGQLIDHHNGIDDIGNGIIRHTDPSTYIEDELRILRAAQFASRFDFKVDKETIELSKSFNLQLLAKERLYEELMKALLKGKKPSIFFNIIDETGLIDQLIPGMTQLKSIEQNPVFHPEGSVWNHTMMVLDKAAELREFSNDPEVLMLSALFHDFGKVKTTKFDEAKGRIISVGHESVDLSTVIESIVLNKKLSKKVQNVIRLHMRPNTYAMNNSKIKAVRKLYVESGENFKELMLLSKADAIGRGIDYDYSQIEKWWDEKIIQIESFDFKPIINGNDLIAMGLTPSPLFKELLEKAYDMQMGGCNYLAIMGTLKQIIKERA